MKSKNKLNKEIAEKIEKLYREHRDVMYADAKFILKDHSLAEDAVESAIEKIIKRFDKVPKDDFEIIYIGLSSALSSTFSNAEIAAKTINEKYGKKLVTCIDSRSGSYGTLILLDKIIELVNENVAVDEIKNIIDEDVKKSFVAFVPTDLSFIYRSGRLTALEAGIGKLFKIVPIVYPTKEDGKLKTGDKCMGMKLALKKLKAKVFNHIKEFNHTRCYISTCNMDKEAEELKKYILENTDIKEENIKVGYIDKTMSCCCGPKTIAIFVR
jgi:DegV family protein with EDD domain